MRPLAGTLHIDAWAHAMAPPWREPATALRRDAKGRERLQSDGDVHGPLDGKESARSALASRDEALLNAWDRLLAIASLYPAGNTRFLEAVALWREAMRQVCRADGTVCIEVGRDDRLAHEGRVQSAERVSRSRLYPLLVGIGVENVVLSMEIAPEALHHTLLVLQDTHRITERTVGLQHAELPPLPEGVSISLRSFGSPGAELPGTTAPTRHLGDPGEDGGSGGGNGGLGNAGGSNTGAGRTGGGSTGAGGSGGGSTGAGGAGGSGAGAGSPGLGLPPGIMDAPALVGEYPAVRNPHVGAQGEAGETLEERLTQRATQLFHDLTRDTVPEPLPHPVDARPQETRGARDPRQQAPFGPADLVAKLQDLDPSLPFEGQQIGPCQPEWLALLLQFAQGRDDVPYAQRARQIIPRVLARDLGLHELQTVVSAAEDLLESGDAPRVDTLLPLVLGPLTATPELLERALAALARGVDATGRECLWPHLADALLRERVPLGLAQVHGIDGRSALALPAEARPRVLARLETRAPLLSLPLPPSIVQPLRPELRDLHLVLLSSSRGASLGPLLHDALLAASPPLPAPHAGLLALLGAYRPQYREYYRLLLEAEGDVDHAARAQEAANLALRALQKMSRRGRQRPEVADALAALAAAPPGDADALLASIQTERWLFILPAWPAEVRRQAERLQARRPATHARDALQAEVQ
jgi:hypothetical protein